VNYQPYPDTARALAQLERGRVQKTPPPSPTAMAAWRFLESLARSLGKAPTEHQRRVGKQAFQRALVDEAVASGEHVHVAERDDVRCAGGDDDCKQPRVGSQAIAGSADRTLTQPVGNAPGKAVLCPACRGKGCMVCLEQQPAAIDGEEPQP
jgi:hypothetical protein